MNRRFAVAGLSVLAFVLSSKAAFSYDFPTYTPTLDKEETVGTDMESAYFSDSLIVKADDDADFFMYEDVNGEKNLIHYSVGYGIKDSVVPTKQIVNMDSFDSLEGHYVYTNTFDMYGGALLNIGQIGDVYGDFIGNSVSGADESLGGAIANLGDGGSIENIYGDFIHNRAENKGGAIYNELFIGNIKGNFIANSVSGDGSYLVGGAFSNGGSVNSIEGDFIGNKIYQLNADYLVAKGGALYSGAYLSIESLKGDFIGNSIRSGGLASHLSGGAIFNDYEGKISNIEGLFYGNSVISEGAHSSVYGGAISNEGGRIYNLNSSFLSNVAVGNAEAKGGAIYNAGNITAIKGDFIGNMVKVTETSDMGAAQGGALSNFWVVNPARMAMSYGNPAPVDYNIIDIQGDFINNAAVAEHDDGSYGRAKGGAIYNVNAINNITGDFIGNYVSGAYGEASGGAIYNDSTLGISTTENKKNILIENNKIIENVDGKTPFVYLNFMDLYAIKDGTRTAGETEYSFIKDSVLNLTSIADSYIDIRDPFRSILDYSIYNEDDDTYDTDIEIGGKGGVINKTGAGGVRLWGDNSEYGGKLNIKEGSFYAMFDDIQDEVNDIQGQRLNFTLQNADVTFENGTTFRPKVTKDTMASLGTKAIVNGNVALIPYNLSSLNIGSYTYKAGNSEFSGWDNSLAKVDTSSEHSTTVNVKRDLSGYDGLSDLADIYRKRSDLSTAERTEIDNIYYTGTVSSAIKEKFAVVSGQDKVIYTEVHKASVRQFGRQIASRIQNKNCKSCGMENGFANEHLWFNVGQNAIDKKTTGDSLGYKYNPTSFAFGYDHDFLPDELNIGLALSYAFGDVKGKGDNIVNKADINEYLVSLYTKYKPLRAYVTGSIGGGLIQTKTKTISDTVSTRGQYDTKVFFVNSEFGYDLGSSCGVIEPFMGLEYAYVYNPSYNEKGIGARHFDSTDWTSIELPIGLRISRNLTYGNYLITPAIEVAYSRNIGDTGTKVNSYFVGNPTSPWVIRGSDDSRDSVRSSFNLKINNLRTPFAFNIGYARDSRSGYKDDQVYVTVRYNF